MIGGPTATGKTGLAIDIAERLLERGVGAEIVSADSRQVYVGMDIGTAKATPEERANVVHHGIDLVEPDEPYSVADFRTHALGALRSLGERGGIGVLAGGTGLWVRAIVAGIDTDALPHDRVVRAEIEKHVRADGLDVAAARLTSIAPALAARTDLRNPRRVARALEIALLRGDEALPAALGYPAPVIAFQLDVEAEAHGRRIRERAEGQFAAGLVDEARRLRDRFDPSLPAFTSIGYREAWACIDGTATLEEAIEADARRNVQFAKRQRTWFRREPSMEPIDATNSPITRVWPAVDAWRTALPAPT